MPLIGFESATQWSEVQYATSGLLYPPSEFSEGNMVNIYRTNLRWVIVALSTSLPTLLSAILTNNHFMYMYSIVTFRLSCLYSICLAEVINSTSKMLWEFLNSHTINFDVFQYYIYSLPASHMVSTRVSIVNPEMLSTIWFYGGNAIYRP